MSEENKLPSRVSITYTVDFAEVPERVKILLTEPANSFEGIAKLCRETSLAVVSDDPVQGTRSLLELKPLITKTSVRIDDCAEIMVGYLKMLESAQPPRTEPDPSPPRNLKRAFVKIDK